MVRKREFVLKILMINQVNYGSTGSIMLGIAQAAEKRGHQVFLCCANGRASASLKTNNTILIGHRFEKNIHRFLGIMTGFHGCFSLFGTCFLIRKIKKIKPDLIHIHNLHGDYIHIPIFFRYLKQSNIPIVWTLHDCWAFTGRCAHFTVSKCNQWKTGCHKCPSLANYQVSKIDVSKIFWRLKRKLYSEIKNLTIVTPSMWLNELVSLSILKKYECITIYNGVNLSRFSPTKSNFRRKYGISNKDTVILGVSSVWNYEKGLDVFVELSKKLGENYRIVLVGVDSKKRLSDNIICVKRTNNQSELAQIYSASDVFVNPTREEVLGLVNIEALACGLPVITFDSGGSPECIDTMSGIVINVDDIDKLITLIKNREFVKYKKSDCIYRASQFDCKKQFEKYIDLYETKVIQ